MICFVLVLWCEAHNAGRLPHERLCVTLTGEKCPSDGKEGEKRPARVKTKGGVHRDCKLCVRSLARHGTRGACPHHRRRPSDDEKTETKFKVVSLSLSFSLSLSLSLSFSLSFSLSLSLSLRALILTSTRTRAHTQYGELSRSGVEALAKHFQLDKEPTAKFVDMGSGTGKIVLHMVTAPPPLTFLPVVALFLLCVEQLMNLCHHARNSQCVQKFARQCEGVELSSIRSRHAQLLKMKV